MGWQALLGRPDGPPAAREVRAGPIRALLDGIDLRYVGDGTVEAVRRVYVAVRDHNWNTIAPQVSDLRLERGEDDFAVTFRARHERGDVAFAWQGEIIGALDGSISYRMRGEAEAAFPFNRIGFCVLHPFAALRGAPFEGRTPDGPVAGRLPDLIAPQRVVDGRYRALFDPVDELTVRLPDGTRVRTGFTGDLFETEDQRNWGDASLKTYCTPLSLGYPHRATVGQRIEQSVRIAVDGPTRRIRPAARPALVEVRLGEPSGVSLGRIGLGSRRTGGLISEGCAERLRAARPDHLRVDVRLADPARDEVLDGAMADSRRLDCGLEVALHLLERDASPLGDLVERLADARLERVLVFAADAASAGTRETTPAALAEMVRSALGERRAPVGGGTDMYFCELNRTRPPAAALDVISWSVNPQVHAFDERSIVESLTALPELVRSARALAGGRPLAVSPVTLRPRFNANATAPEEAGAQGADDPRQASWFGAAWTLGTVSALMGAGVDSITLFEPTGPAGLMPTGGGEPYPLFAVLAALADLRGAGLVRASVSDELRATSLAVRAADGTIHVLIANLTPRAAEIELHGLPAGRATIGIRGAGHESATEAEVSAGRRVGLELTPYGLAVIEAVERSPR